MTFQNGTMRTVGFCTLCSSPYYHFSLAAKMGCTLCGTWQCEKSSRLSYGRHGFSMVEILEIKKRPKMLGSLEA